MLKALPFASLVAVLLLFKPQPVKAGDCIPWFKLSWWSKGTKPASASAHIRGDGSNSTSSHPTLGLLAADKLVLDISESAMHGAEPIDSSPAPDLVSVGAAESQTQEIHLAQANDEIARRDELAKKGVIAGMEAAFTAIPKGIDSPESFFDKYAPLLSLDGSETKKEDEQMTREEKQKKTKQQHLRNLLSIYEKFDSTALEALKRHIKAVEDFSAWNKEQQHLEASPADSNKYDDLVEYADKLRMWSKQFESLKNSIGEVTTSLVSCATEVLEDPADQVTFVAAYGPVSAFRAYRAPKKFVSQGLTVTAMPQAANMGQVPVEFNNLDTHNKDRFDQFETLGEGFEHILALAKGLWTNPLRKVALAVEELEMETDFSDASIGFPRGIPGYPMDSTSNQVSVHQASQDLTVSESIRSVMTIPDQGSVKFNAVWAAVEEMVDLCLSLSSTWNAVANVWSDKGFQVLRLTVWRVTTADVEVCSQLFQEACAKLSASVQATTGVADVEQLTEAEFERSYAPLGDDSALAYKELGVSLTQVAALWKRLSASVGADILAETPSAARNKMLAVDNIMVMWNYFRLTEKQLDENDGGFGQDSSMERIVWV